MSRTKAHLSAPTDLNPRMGSRAPSLENWDDAGKAPSTQQAPRPLPLEDHGKGWAGIRAKAQRWNRRRGGRQATHSQTCWSSGHPHPPPALTPTTQNSHCPRFTLTGVGSLLAGLVFCWFMLFSSSNSATFFYIDLPPHPEGHTAVKGNLRIPGRKGDPHWSQGPPVSQAKQCPSPEPCGFLQSTLIY